MLIYCEAIVDHPVQQDNLIQCIELLNGKPEISGNRISVEFDASDGECDIMMSLFEHYGIHNITVLT